nr:uncharacterized protein LOC101265971 [Solanum lycopersicum]
MGSSAGKLPAINAKVMRSGHVLSKQQRIHLCTDITEQEIYTTLQSIGNDKAPGIDGYNALFFKHTWKIIKKDVIEAVISFFTTGKLFKPFNWRKIAGNIILDHELVKDYTRKNISPRSMLKIDLQKTYDSVEWTFLEQVMVGLGFPEMFIQWVMHCVKTMNYTIVVNGQTTQRFDAAKDLRQGDPMSPFL